MADTHEVLSSISAMTGLSSVTMAASVVTKATANIKQLDLASMCPCQDVPLGGGGEVAESLQGSGSMTIVTNLPVQGGSMYYFLCKVCMLSDPPDQMWTTFKLTVITKLTSGNNTYHDFGKMNQVCMADGYVDMGGDLTADSDAKSITILLSCTNDKVELSVEAKSLKLTQILDNPQWRSAADARIQILRKGNVTLRVKVSEDYDPKQLKFQLQQSKSSFPWGTAVDSGPLGGSLEQDQKYREFLQEYFTWATPTNDVKWRLMERQEGQMNFRGGDTCLDVLLPAGFKVRGHCLMWARTSKIPSWLSPKPPAEVEENVHRRLKYVADRWKGKFSHWDVNNEQLHEAWYAEKLEQPDFLSRVHKEYHDLDPTPALFVNDFYVFGNGLFTQAYKQKVQKLKKDKAPVGGIGIQAHISYTANISLLLKRLEVLSEPEVPLWLTEFDVNLKDEPDEEAQMYEDVVRLCFSHPSIHGIVLWGFLDKIVDSKDMQLNENGKRLYNLWRKEWWTQEVMSLPVGTECGHQVEVSTTAFHGSYTLTVEYKDQSVWKHDVEVKPDEDLVIDIDL